MSKRYTKGPWEVIKDGSNPHDRRITSRHASVPTHIAKVYGWDDNGSPNATLIASAPELLDALQNAMGILDTPIGRRKLGISSDEEWLNDARAAIAKAKGE